MLEILWNISVKYCETAHLETVFGRSSLKVLLNTTSAPKLFSPAFLTILSSFWPLFFGGCFFHSSLSLNFLKHVTWINVMWSDSWHPRQFPVLSSFLGLGKQTDEQMDLQWIVNLSHGTKFVINFFPHNNQNCYTDNVSDKYHNQSSSRSPYNLRWCSPNMMYAIIIFRMTIIITINHHHIKPEMVLASRWTCTEARGLVEPNSLVLLTQFDDHDDDDVDEGRSHVTWGSYYVDKAKFILL